VVFRGLRAFVVKSPVELATQHRKGALIGSLEENNSMTALQLGIMIVVTAITGGVQQQVTSEGAATLQGTKWPLVKFQGGTGSNARRFEVPTARRR
jgi:hypothetical protein